MEMGSQWLDAKQAAMHIGRKAKNSYKSMLSLARQGKVKAGFNGRTFVFKPEDLDALLIRLAKREVR